VALGGLLLASISAQPAAAQVVSPTLSTAPTAQRMPFTADAYPRVSSAAGPNVLKSIRLASTGDEVLADRLIVKFQPATTAAERLDVHARVTQRVPMAGRPVGQLTATSYLVDVSGAPSLEDAARAYRADPRVIGVGPDKIGQIDETPNDPRFSSQWDMTRIQLPAAWNRTHGGSGGGTIAILDTGIDETHPDLAGRVSYRKDFTGSSSGTTDVHGHGTHVAGIAGAVANNGQAIAGVGYNTWLLNGKVADDSGKLALSSLIDGINWATEYGAEVINMSLGASSEHFYDDCNPDFWEDALDIGVNELRDAIGDAWSSGVVLVASAGNKGNGFQQWPGSCPNVLSVANTTQDDSLASNSTRGTWVDVAAPGSGILSLAPGGGTATKSGASQAAPHVSGLAVLVRASCQLSTPQPIVDRITSTADQIAGTGSLFRFGRINAFNAVCVPKPQNLHAGVVTSTSIEVKWTDMTPGEVRYELVYGPTGGPATTALTLPANTQSYIHPNVAPGASFDYQVRACDVNGCSDWSNKATVESNTRKLTVSRTGFGTVTGSGIACGSDCQEIYSYGTAVTLTAKDFSNTKVGTYWAFDHWEGACSGTVRTCTVNMTLNRSVRAVFVDLSE
jgi:thermitase